MTKRLPRLPYGWKEQPQLFERYWDDAMTSIEKTLNDILAIPGIEDAINAANTAAANAQAAADTAITATNNAEVAAESAMSVAALTSSGVTGITLTATDAGTDASISISAHTRVYGDGSSVSVSAGVLTGLAYSTVYYIYYDQPSRAGGTVTYVSTTDKATATQTGDRHLVGLVSTPAAGAAANDGNYVDAPGFGGVLY